MADPTTPGLQTPADAANVTGNVLEFVFTIPSDADSDNLVFMLELDTNAVIDSGNADYKSYESRLSTDQGIHGRWEYYTGSAWVEMPTWGVDLEFYGNNARVTIRKEEVTQGYPTLNTIWYWRVAVGDRVRGVFNDTRFTFNTNLFLSGGDTF